MVSIPSNIAEGRYRHTRKDFHNFLNKAYSSGAELETQIEIAKRLVWGQKLNFSKVDILLDEIMKILNKMTNNLRS
jgi:four helix bundle protein